jgi:hypothetical protein
MMLDNVYTVAECHCICFIGSPDFMLYAIRNSFVTENVAM